MNAHASHALLRTAAIPAPATAWSPIRHASRRHLPLRRAARVVAAVVAALCVGVLAGFIEDRFFADRGSGLSGETLNLVVERIVQAESRGDANAKNPRSTATGAAQFIDATWLEMIRRHRADLSGRSEAEILDLRRDATLAREITARFVERNAVLLRKRGLPITPGTLYLSHFAGGAGAAAILLAPEDADAAHIMATADVTGRMSREKLVRANPFLEGVTAGGLKKWADQKMKARGRS